MQKLIDLSHTVEHGLITYKGLPAPVVCDYLSREESEQRYAKGETFQIGKIEMVANTGTYVDAPFHRFESGCDLAGLALESLAELVGVHVRVPGQHEISVAAFAGLDVSGKAVLVESGWSKHWNTETYYTENPFLTEEAAVYLRDSGAVMVGIDSLNIDDTSGKSRPVHATLLGAGIPIVEHLCNLDAIPPGAFRFHAVPVKVKGMGTFPVRAYAVAGD